MTLIISISYACLWNYVPWLLVLTNGDGAGGEGAGGDGAGGLSAGGLGGGDTTKKRQASLMVTNIDNNPINVSDFISKMQLSYSL